MVGTSPPGGRARTWARTSAGASTTASGSAAFPAVRCSTASALASRSSSDLTSDPGDRGVGEPVHSANDVAPAQKSRVLVPPRAFWSSARPPGSAATSRRPHWSSGITSPAWPGARPGPCPRARYSCRHRDQLGAYDQVADEPAPRAPPDYRCSALRWTGHCAPRAVRRPAWPALPGPPSCPVCVRARRSTRRPSRGGGSRG